MMDQKSLHFFWVSLKGLVFVSSNVWIVRFV